MLIIDLIQLLVWYIIIGAIIGVIAGGGKGAAIGAIIGGGVGTAGVMTQRGKDIRLERGQHMKIRTSTDTSAL